jgi:hypothetical protein
LNPSYTTHQLCDVGKFTYPLSAPFHHLENSNNSNSPYFIGLL